MLDENKLLQAIQKAREGAKKRNFTQSFDVIVKLKDLDLKKPEQQVEFFLNLPKSKGKENKICAFVGPELRDSAEEVCDKVYREAEFMQFVKDKKGAKKVAGEFDVFLAQANLMGKVAAAFGRVLGPRGKMPNPKSGAVVPPKGNIKAIYERMKNTIKFSAKTKMTVQVPVGNENSSDDDVKANVVALYNTLISALPNRENNFKGMVIKLTMGSPAEVQ